MILFAGFFYLLYGVSYRDLEEIMAERDLTIVHYAEQVGFRYAELLSERARHRKCHTDRSWRMDETYIHVKKRDKAAATKFFARALAANGLPRKIVIDKSGANTTGIIAGR